MNKYKVKVTHVFSELINVEAENEEAAKLAAKEQIEAPDRTARPMYEATIPEEHWAVISEEEFNNLVEAQTQEPSNIITP